MPADDEPIRVQQTFDCPRSELWTALTDPAQMRRWFFEPIRTFEPRPGFATTFTVELEDIAFVHHWTVTEVEPERRLVYEWVYGGYPGRARSEFELESTDRGSVLTLTWTVLEDLPQERVEFHRASGVEGWTWFITESLPKFLADRSA